MLVFGVLKVFGDGMAVKVESPLSVVDPVPYGGHASDC